MVSLDFWICFDLGKCSMVLMLWSLSHIFTNITLTSFEIANIIFWRLLASLSDEVFISKALSLLTPSTISATSFPNNFARSFFLTSQSSRISCINAAHIESGSILSSKRMLATFTGCVIYFEPSFLFWPSWE